MDRIWIRLQRTSLYISLFALSVVLPTGQRAWSQRGPEAGQNNASTGSTKQPGIWASFVNAPACGEELLSQGRNDVVRVESGAEPGATDPMAVPSGRYQLFPDHGIAASMEFADQSAVKYFTTDSDPNLRLDQYVDLQTGPDDPYGSGPPQEFPAVGRILRPDRDTLVTAKREGNAFANGTRVSIDFPGEGHSTYLDDQLLPRQTESNDFLAIASGDLDNIADAQGNYHDEVVVARVTGESSAGGKLYYRYHLDVLNYGSGKLASPEITDTSYAELAPAFTNNSGTTLGSDVILSVSVGDFRGDGHREIVLTALGDGTLLLYTYRYETENGEHRLRQIASQYIVMQGGPIPGTIGSQRDVGTISSAAGDFDGDGAEELGVAYAKWKDSTYGVGVLLFKYDANFQAQLTSANFAHYPDITSSTGNNRLSRPKVQLAAGQFLLLPPTIPYGRKQLALAWNSAQETLQVEGIQVSNDAKTLTSFAKWSENNSAGISFAMAAGHFQGAAGTLPVASVALSSWSGATAPSEFKIEAFFVNQNEIKPSGSTYSLKLSSPANAAMRLFLAAYDRPGNSRYLGSPAHLQIQNVVNTDYIMQEPPKHAYWSETAHKVENLTRFDRNNVHLFNANTASMSTSSKDHSARTTGGSVAVSAGATGTAGSNWGILKAEATQTVDVTAKASYDYNENKETYDSGYRSRTITSTGQTDRDDYLKGGVQLIDVWRYRVYGTPTGGDLNAFYEIVLPGQTVPFAGGGMNFDWYQPRHENGNILSYPSSLGVAASPLIPTDMGSYTLPNGLEASTPQVPAQLYFFDASSGTTELRYSDEIASGSSFTYSHEIAESADLKATYTAAVTTPVGSGEARFCGSVEFHNSNSWGGTNTSDETTTEETAVTLNKAPGTSNAAYPFYPVLYTTTDGTMKLSFSAPDPTDRQLNPAGANLFAGLYGGLPDPALNLPARLVPNAAGSGELEQWIPNKLIDRKRIRGLFLRKSAVDDADQTYPLFAFNPVDGDTVRIEPRVYNFSTSKPATGTVVEFQAIGYDSSTNSELCDQPINGGPGLNTGLVCPRSARQGIGTATIARLEPRQFTCVSGFDDPATTGCAPPVYLNWNTRGFGPSIGGASEYRIYIALNPGAAPGTEIYGSDPDPVKIMSVTNETPMVVHAPGHHLATGDYAQIGNVQGLNAANGTFQVTRISDDEFSLDGTFNSAGSYTGGGIVTGLDPGQNNEGFGYISIARAQNLAGATKEERSPHDYLENDALEALTEDRQPHLEASRAQATLNAPLQLRFRARSTAVHHDAARMLLFDGEPTSGTPAIADKVIHPGSHGREGSSVWFTWTPSTSGVHSLYAVLVEGDGVRDEAGRLEVEVQADPASR